jgi:hypothetical protein
MGTITKMVQQCTERCWPKQIKLDKLQHLGWGDAADYLCEPDNQDGTSQLTVPGVIKTEMDAHAGLPLQTTFGENTEYLDIIPAISQMPQGVLNQEIII